MTASTEYILFVTSALIISSVLASKISSRLGVPALLLFLGIGMLAGVQGIGHITFDEPQLAQFVGVVALAFILFAGGLGTHLDAIRPVLWQGIGLSTVGVLVTTVAAGWFASVVLKLPLLEGMLLGAIISSTDAAAVFSVLRSHHISLKGNLNPLLEFESGSNDPMAIFLTIGILQLLTKPGMDLASVVGLFVTQMLVGGAAGYLLGRGAVWLFNTIKLESEGLYPVLSVATVALTYGATAAFGGSGSLAVYVMGLTMSNRDFIHKRSLAKFHDGIAWLAQITMFLTLGLLVVPSHLLAVATAGLLCAAFLMFVARPLGVFSVLSFSGMPLRALLFTSWVGLRGAIPIVLATFPLLAHLPNAQLIFNVVFFIVLASVLLQGTSLPFVARLLGVDAPAPKVRKPSIDFEQVEGSDAQLLELIVPYNAAISGKQIVDAGLPADVLISLVSRNDSFIIPNGKTVLEEGDVLFVLVNNTDLAYVRKLIQRLNSDADRTV